LSPARHCAKPVSLKTYQLKRNLIIEIILTWPVGGVRAMQLLALDRISDAPRIDHFVYRPPPEWAHVSEAGDPVLARRGAEGAGMTFKRRLVYARWRGGYTLRSRP